MTKIVVITQYCVLTTILCKCAKCIKAKYYSPKVYSSFQVKKMIAFSRSIIIVLSINFVQNKTAKGCESF